MLVTAGRLAVAILPAGVALLVGLVLAIVRIRRDRRVAIPALLGFLLLLIPLVLGAVVSFVLPGIITSPRPGFIQHHLGTLSGVVSGVSIGTTIAGWGLVLVALFRRLPARSPATANGSEFREPTPTSGRHALPDRGEHPDGLPAPVESPSVEPPSPASPTPERVGAHSGGAPGFGAGPFGTGEHAAARGQAAGGAGPVGPAAGPVEPRGRHAQARPSEPDTVDHGLRPDPEASSFPAPTPSVPPEGGHDGTRTERAADPDPGAAAPPGAPEPHAGEPEVAEAGAGQSGASRPAPEARPRPRPRPAETPTPTGSHAADTPSGPHGAGAVPPEARSGATEAGGTASAPPSGTGETPPVADDRSPSTPPRRARRRAPSGPLGALRRLVRSDDS